MDVQITEIPPDPTKVITAQVLITMSEEEWKSWGDSLANFRFNEGNPFQGLVPELRSFIAERFEEK